MTNTTTDKVDIERPAWLPTEAWPFEIRTAVIDGTPVAYTDEGNGPLLLLVHDGMWSYIWGQLIDRLRTNFRVITLDFPGSGLSPDRQGNFGLEADSKILEALVDQLGLEKVTLVVHDLGGGVGLGMAGRRPSLIKAMVMVNTFAWAPDVRSLRVMLRLMGSKFVTGLDLATNLIPRLSAGGLGTGRLLDEEGQQAFLGPFRDRGPRRRFHQLMGSALAEGGYLGKVEESLRDSLADRPVLTIYGERNDPFGFQKRFRELLSNVEEMVIPRGNHFPMSDDPDSVAQRISEWHRREVESRSV